MVCAVIKYVLLALGVCLHARAAPVGHNRDQVFSDDGCNDPKMSNKTECLLMTRKILKPYLNGQASDTPIHVTKRSSGNGLPVTSTCDFSGRGLSASGEINGDSFSPFAIDIDVDVHRVPKVIPKKWCLCMGCINRSGKEDLGLASVNLTSNILTYRRNAQGEFDPHIILVNTGCTCAMPL